MMSYFGEQRVILLTQYAMKDRKVGRFVRARYYNNIKSFTSDPTDRDIIEEHIIM